jgi:hypothetical protein
VRLKERAVVPLPLMYSDKVRALTPGTPQRTKMILSKLPISPGIGASVVVRPPRTFAGLRRGSPNGPLNFSSHAAATSQRASEIPAEFTLKTSSDVQCTEFETTQRG